MKIDGLTAIIVLIILRTVFCVNRIFKHINILSCFSCSTFSSLKSKQHNRIEEDRKEKIKSTTTEQIRQKRKSVFSLLLMIGWKRCVCVFVFDQNTFECHLLIFSDSIRDSLFLSFFLFLSMCVPVYMNKRNRVQSLANFAISLWLWIHIGRCLLAELLICWIVHCDSQAAGLHIIVAIIVWESVTRKIITITTPSPPITTVVRIVKLQVAAIIASAASVLATATTASTVII